MIRIYCDKAHAVLKETEILTAGMLNYPEVHLTYSDDLAGYGKAAIVRAGTVERAVTVVDDAFIVPYECLADSGVNLIVGIRFVGATPVIPSIWCDCGMIYDGADPDSGSTGEATQALVDQMIEYAALVAQEAEGMDESIIRSFLLNATNINQYGTATASITDTGPGANRTITLTLSNLKGNGVEAVAWITTGENKGRLQIRTSDNVVTNFDGFVDALAYIEGIQNTSAIDAAEAATAASNAEAWAVGERDGDPVTSEDVTYENNSKYYAEQAGDYADVAEYYAGKAEAASGLTIDDELNPTSQNLVRNMAIANAFNALDSEMDTKQNAESGKGLSTEDFTTEYKNKLDGIVDGANVANLAYDTVNKKITKTINGTTADVVSVATLKSDMDLNASDIPNDSTVTGTNVDDALDNLNDAISDVEDDVSDLQSAISDVEDIVGDGSLTGFTATDLTGAANELNGAITSLGSDDIANDSTNVSGSKVTNALDTLNGAISDVEDDVSDLQSAISKDNISETIFYDSATSVSNLNNCKYGSNAFNTSTTNTPETGYGTCYYFRSGSWEYQLAFVTNGHVYLRKNINNGGWNAWEGLNTVEEGTVTTSEVSDLFDKTVKKQGKVVNLNITTSTGTSATLGLNYSPDLFTIPAGFRPPVTIFVPAIYYLNGQTATVTLARITSNGQVGLLTQTNNTNIGYIRLVTTYFVD